MILYIRKTSNFEQVENFLLNHPDKEYKTSRFVYYFKIVGDCAGIFRRATETCTGEAARQETTRLLHTITMGSFNNDSISFLLRRAVRVAVLYHRCCNFRL